MSKAVTAAVEASKSIESSSQAMNAVGAMSMESVKGVRGADVLPDFPSEASKFDVGHLDDRRRDLPDFEDKGIVSGNDLPNFESDKLAGDDSSSRTDESTSDESADGRSEDISTSNDIESGAESQTENQGDSTSKSDTQENDSCCDDNGKVYKDADGNLLPNTEYEVNGTKYKTDDKGRIVSAEGYLKDTPENDRDNTAQTDAGGKDRKPGDDGGHLRARRNGGSSGNENLVAMRGTINRGDYARSENEESQMLKDGKQVYEKIEITYDDDSSRPSKIEKTYTDGEKTVTVTVDNVEGSTDLVETIKGDVSDRNLNNLRNEIEDMKVDGNEVSVTSVRREYDSDGNLKSVTVGVTNETVTPREKHYHTYAPNNGGRE